jgi:hypothetical protein
MSSAVPQSGQNRTFGEIENGPPDEPNDPSDRASTAGAAHEEEQIQGSRYKGQNARNGKEDPRGPALLRTSTTMTHTIPTYVMVTPVRFCLEIA